MDASLTATKGHLRQAIDDKIKPLEDSIRVLKYHRNALAPISTLPPEILTDIFSILSYSACHARASDNEKVGYLAWLWVTHVCRHWREIALNHPRLWGHINFTKLTPAGIDAILARAKMTPLHLEATVMSEAQFDAFGQQLEAHISHVRRLSLSGQIPTVLERIISSSPVLESLSLRNAPTRFSSRFSPALSLLNITAPKLASLELTGCDISWKSPLLRGLRTLEILKPSREARPTLDDWLDALSEMAQLETLILDSASPIVPVGDRFTSEPSHTVTLPFLTQFDIIASAKGCELALAHLVFPALTSLSVEATSYRRDGDDVLRIIPHIARNARGPAPLRSMAISANRSCALICAWTIPDADVMIVDSGSMFYGDESSARVVLGATTRGDDRWRYGTDSEIADALLTLLPINEILTLSTWDDTRLSKEFWFRHAPRLAMLNRAYLVSTAIKAFREMISIVAPGERPRLPRLTELILGNVTLTTLRTCNLLSMLMKRMEQGIPLQSLDIRTCYAAELAIQVLPKAVGELQVPVGRLTIGDPATSSDTDDVTDVHYDSFEGEGDESDYTDV